MTFENVRQPVNASHKCQADGNHGHLSESEQMDLPGLECPVLMPSDGRNLRDTMNSPAATRLIPAVGARVAERYEIRKVLDQDRCLATDHVLGTDVCLRFVKGDSARLSELADAAAESSRLSHPLLARVLGFHQTAGHAFIVTEAVTGTTLRDELNSRTTRNQRFSVEEVLRIAGDLCRCLAACHGQSAHGNVCPETIVLASNGSAVLTDYGVARLIVQNDCQQNASRAQVARHHDVKAVAEVVYELLTGQKPDDDARSPREIRSTVPERLSRVIMRSMSSDAASRNVSIHRLHQQLQRAAAPKTHPAVTIAAVAAVGISTALLICGVRNHQNRQAAIEMQRQAQKPEFARRLGMVNELRKQSDSLLAWLTAEPQRLTREVEKWEKELANAEDSGKATQATHARQKLNGLRPELETAERIAEIWDRHLSRQEWQTAAAGHLAAAETLGKDGAYEDAVENLNSAEAAFNSIVAWHGNVASILADHDLVQTQLDERSHKYPELDFDPYSRPNELLQTVHRQLLAGDGSESQNTLRQAKTLIDSVDKLMPTRTKVESLRQRPAVVGELPELQQEYSDIDTLLLSGDELLTQGKPTDAATYYSQAETRYAGAPARVVESLFSMLDAVENPHQGLHLIDEILRVQLSEKEDRVRRTRALQRRATLHLNLQRPQQAAEDLTMAIKLDADNADLYAQRATVWMSLSETPRAIEDCEQAISLDHNQVDIAVQLAELYVSENQHELAFARYGWALERRPDRLDARLGRATVAMQKQNWADALEDCSFVLMHDAAISTAWQISMIANFELGHFDKTIEDCSRLIDVEPQCGMAYAYRAAAQVERNDFQSAIQDATLAISKCPDSAWCYRIRARAKFGHGESEAAQHDYQVAMRLTVD
ncbi:tetratricopeptide repeat protein [bacterium]|nr:tetratricopeptide repeat protein [bacterium]